VGLLQPDLRALNALEFAVPTENLPEESSFAERKATFIFAQPLADFVPAKRT